MWVLNPDPLETKLECVVFSLSFPIYFQKLRFFNTCNEQLFFNWTLATLWIRQSHYTCSMTSWGHSARSINPPLSFPSRIPKPSWVNLRLKQWGCLWTMSPHSDTKVALIRKPLNRSGWDEKFPLSSVPSYQHSFSFCVMRGIISWLQSDFLPKRKKQWEAGLSHGDYTSIPEQFWSFSFLSYNWMPFPLTINRKKVERY